MLLCQRLPITFRMKSKPLSRVTRPGRTPQAPIFPLAAHTHIPTRRLSSARRFSDASCSFSLPALAQVVPSALPLFTSLLPWLMPPGCSEPRVVPPPPGSFAEHHRQAPWYPALHTSSLRFLLCSPYRPRAPLSASPACRLDRHELRARYK